MTFPTAKTSQYNWIAADATARDAIGSSDGLKVSDFCDLLSNGSRYYCTSVDGADASTWAPAPAGAPETLASTLTAGNATGGTDISMTSGDQIVGTGTIAAVAATGATGASGSPGYQAIVTAGTGGQGTAGAGGIGANAVRNAGDGGVGTTDGGDGGNVVDNCGDPGAAGNADGGGYTCNLGTGQGTGVDGVWEVVGPTGGTMSFDGETGFLEIPLSLRYTGGGTIVAADGGDGAVGVAGGGVQERAGDGGEGTAGAGGDGGILYRYAGDGGPGTTNGGDGGDLLDTCGNAGSGGNADGGDYKCTLGTGQGGGTDGKFTIVGPTGGNVVFDGETGITTFPNDLEIGSGGPTIGTCSGTPEGAEAADVGSIRQRTDGGAGTSLYVKESGTGNTGWVAVGAPSALSEYHRVTGINGRGSTNDNIYRYDSVAESNGTDISYTDSATDGGYWTINTTGIYSISMFASWEDTLTDAYIAVDSSLNNSYALSRCRVRSKGANNDTNPQTMTWIGPVSSGQKFWIADAAGTYHIGDTNDAMVTVTRLA